MHSVFDRNDIGCSSCQRLRYNAMLIGCNVNILGIIPSLLAATYVQNLIMEMS